MYGEAGTFFIQLSFSELSFGKYAGVNVVIGGSILGMSADSALLFLNEARRTGAYVFNNLSEEWPEYVILDPRRGILFVDVFFGSPDDGDAIEIRQRALSAKSVAFKESFPAFLDIPRVRKLLLVGADSQISASSFHTLTNTWHASATEYDGIYELRRLLEPAFVFSSRPSVELADADRGSRENGRFILDKEQAIAAENMESDIRIVSGPAGSGKTLVLIARARILAERHPSWNIQILCYSSVLALYLGSIFADYANIRVDTFHAWQRREGMDFSGSDCARAARSLARLKNISPSIDALLVDEIQDFCPAWVTAALMHTFRGRGGVLMVGDPNQSLFGERGLLQAIDDLGLEFESIHLPRPYRSTRQILEVVNALSGEFDVENKTLAPDGPVVDLVFTSESIDSKAAYIARRIEELVQLGLNYSDVCVTAPNNYDVRALAGALQRADVPVLPFWRNDHDISDVDFEVNKVKLLTAWKAKGLEFDSVLMVGFDHLKDPNQFGLPSGEREIRESFARLCLVAPTRARNYLSIVYSRTNVFLERLAKHESLIRELRWPGDFEGVEN